MLENTEVVAQNGQSIETGNAGHTRKKNENLTKTRKPNTMCVRHY